MSEFDNPFDPTLAERCEWAFKSDPRADREGWYSAEAIAHPAKMDVQLAKAITAAYTKPGWTVIDPMSGVGTNVVESVKQGRNVVALELELPFANMQAGSLALTIAKLQAAGELRAGVRLYCGNSKEARSVVAGPMHSAFGKLNDTLTAEAMITSPPFAEMNHPMGRTDEAIQDRYPHDCGYPDNPANIGGMKYGTIDGLITSPPFPCANRGGKGFDGVQEDGSSTEMYGNLKVGRIAQALSEDPGNLDNVKNYGAPGIVANKPTFLGELYLILQASASLIRAGGVAVIHSKDSVKAGKRVRMGADVIAIMEYLGFTHVPCPECGYGAAHTHRRRIPKPSFWVNARVGRWLADNVPGITLEREIVGMNRTTGKPETKNNLFQGDTLLDGAAIRALAVKHDCPYAGYFEDILVFRKA